MSKAKRQELIDAIKSTSCCLVLETTNSINRALRSKIHSARNAKKHIKSITNRTPYSGLVYCNPSNRAYGVKSLDVIAKIDSFNQDIALAALEQAMRDARREADAQIAKEFSEHIREGFPLDELLYIPQNSWKKFREKHPEIVPEAKDRKEYLTHTSNTRGKLIESYVLYALKSQVPSGKIFTNYEYSLPSGRCDIDIIVTGPAEQVLGAINNPAYFKNITQSKDVRKISGRIKRVA
ncbi:hypothetical protein D6825_01945 [Candidatus Woesearchaeota archaeon]|nr:MAG: hypothetical protein D6825_01945 [Candidatus Woesearchaeota archaeon]